MLPSVTAPCSQPLRAFSPLDTLSGLQVSLAPRGCPLPALLTITGGRADSRPQPPVLPGCLRAAVQKGLETRLWGAGGVWPRPPRAAREAGGGAVTARPLAGAPADRALRRWRREPAPRCRGDGSAPLPGGTGAPRCRELPAGVTPAEHRPFCNLV